MERRSQAPEKIGVNQGQSTRRTEYSRRMASLYDAKSHHQQDNPAANQRRTSSSNEFNIKASAHGASKSDDSSLQVLQPTRRRDSVVSNSSHEKKSPISLQQRRIESQSDAKSYRQQDKPASSSNENSKLKREQQAQRSSRSSQVRTVRPSPVMAPILQPTWRRDSVVSNSSHKKKSPISLQHRQPTPYSYSSKSHLVSVRSLDAGRRQKKIAGGGGPGEESSSLKQPLLGDTTKQEDTTKQQTFNKEGNEAYRNAYNSIEESYKQGKISVEDFEKAIDTLDSAYYENKK